MEVTQAGGTQAEPATQPQAGTPPTNTTAATTPANPPAGADPSATTQAATSEQMSLDEAKKLRQEHNALRKRIAEYEAAQKAADDAKLSETEKLAKRAEAAEQLAAQRLERAIASDIKLAAQGMAFHDPTDAVDRVLPQVRDIADEGERDKAIAKALEELVKAKPYLVAAANGTAQAGQPQRPPAQSGPAMNPARGQGQAAQAIPNRPLRGWDAVNWKER